MHQVVQATWSPPRPLCTASPRPQARTFTPQHGAVPDHAALLQDAGDGLGALRPKEAFVTQEGDGTSQLQAVSKPLPVHWNAWIRALIVPESCVEGGQGCDQAELVCRATPFPISFIITLALHQSPKEPSCWRESQIPQNQPGTAMPHWAKSR